MADIDLHPGFACRGQPVLQFVGKHHLREFALRVGPVLVIILVPVHVVELDCLDPHIIAKAADDHDPAFCRFDPVEQQAAQQEVAIVVRPEHAFVPVDSELLRRHLRDGRVADEGIDPGDGFQHFLCRRADAGQIGKVHTHEGHIDFRAELVFQLRDRRL